MIYVHNQIRVACLITISILISAMDLLYANPAQVKSPQFTKEPFLLGAPVALSVPKAPSVFQGSDGKMHLTYELHVANFGPCDLQIKSVEIHDAVTSASLTAYSDSELDKRIFRFAGSPASTTEKGGEKLGVSSFIVIFISLDFAGQLVPAAFQHSVSVSAPGLPDQGSKTVVGARISVGQSTRSIGPPLRGGPWWAANGPSNQSGHRRAEIVVDGTLHVAERFATDWAKGGDDGQLFKGDESKNSSYYGYGAEVLAVADGVVASVQDDIPENIPESNTTAVPINLKTVAGNYIILDIGAGQFAFYAHLQPHSLRIKPGDKVHRGQMLALLGNSGNSTGPHLHFHISDGNSPLGADGIPYVFESFDLLGSLEGDKFVPLTEPKHCSRQLPLENNIILFP
jgi:hypothetical protein